MDVLLWLIGIGSALWRGFLHVAGWLAQSWPRVIVALVLGAGLYWFGKSLTQEPVPQVGPGSYVPAPLPVPSGPVNPQSIPPSTPVVVLPPQRTTPRLPPIIQAEAIPELDGIKRPPAPPPAVPEPPFGVVYGYRPPIGPAPYRP